MTPKTLGELSALLRSDRLTLKGSEVPLLLGILNEITADLAALAAPPADDAVVLTEANHG